MYVIFPLDQLLDINSADKSKSKKDLNKQSGGLKRQTVEVLIPTHPGQQPLTSPVNQSPAVLGTKQISQDRLLPPQEKVVFRGTSSSPTKSPSTLPLPLSGAQPHQQQVSTSSCSGASSIAPPSPTVSLGLPSGSSPALGLKKKVAQSVSWAGPCNEDEKLSRSSSTYSCRDQPGRNSAVSLSVNTSDSPKGQVVKSEIPRSQLIYSDSFRSNKESFKTSSLPRDERAKNKLLKSSEPISTDIKTEVLAVKEGRPAVRGESIKAPKPDLRAELKSELGSIVKPKLKPDPPPKLRLFEPGQELSEFGLFTGGSESVGLEGSFFNSDVKNRSSPGLVRGASTKSSRGFPTLPTPSSQPPSPSRRYARSDMAGEASLKDLTHPTLNDTLKCHNSVTFKLIKTVSDFTAQLSHLHERHAEDLQHLVENFRKKHSDLRNEKAPCASIMFQAWESLLQEVEVDSQLHSDVAGTLIRQVSRPLIEKTFHRKIQSRKLFTHRESIETILAKTEEMLKKCRKEHMEAYQAHCRTQSNASLATYFDAHNAYVQQLYATNAMLHFYNTNCLPGLLQELEEVYTDVGNVFIESIFQGSEILSVKALDQNKRYDALNSTCRASDPRTDIACFVKYFDSPQLQQKGIPQHRFILPAPPAPPEGEIEEPLVLEPPVVPPLRNELVLDRLAAISSRSRVEALKKEGDNLEKQIAALQEGMEALLRLQQRNLESCLYHKANELQEDISMKRFDLRVNQVHLSAVKAQKELFASKEGPNTDSRERKMSNSSTGSMKSKWMKAFKSLKTPSGGGGGPSSGGASGRDIEKKNGREGRDARAERGIEAPTTLFENSHILQEYTYKKITACDVCHQILRGHSRQGLKCRLCKMNVHFECQERLPRCAPKSRLLRRQRSTSEIESKQIDAGDDDGKSSEEVDLIYQVLKQAGDLSGRRSTHGSMERDLGGSGHSSGSGSASSLQRRQPHPRPTHTGSTLTVNPPPIASSSAPISPRRQKLNLRMKSFSLDSPESTEQRRRHGGSSSAHSSHAPSYCQSPSSPVHNRRLLSTRTMRMSSVELPDENEKSLSSASTSPCPSPVSKKPHRLLPTNLYVVLYNFTSRHPDELDLRAGYKVTVTDTSDPDWWQGKCLGRTGYFPSKYVTRLNGGEKPLQVTHNLQVSDGENGIKLLRDQIVIQIGEEIDGMVMIRNGDNQQGVCPVKYLQEA